MRELNGEVKQSLLAPFEAAEIRIKTRPAVMPYVTARVVMVRLDETIPFQWSFELGERWHDERGTLSQKATLVLHNPSGPDLRYEDIGISGPDVANSPAKQAKAATSDAFKRCAVHAGIGRLLYELSGVTAGRLAKSGVERACAAVGWRGEIEAKHFGAIGGTREGDLEDEEENAPGDPPPAGQNAAPAGNGGGKAGEDRAPAGSKAAAVSPQEVGLTEAKAEFKRLGAEVGVTEKEKAAVYFSGLGIAYPPKSLEDWQRCNEAFREHARRLATEREKQRGEVTEAFPERDRYVRVAGELRELRGLKTDAAWKTWLSGAGLLPHNVAECGAIADRIEALIARAKEAKEGAAGDDPFDWDSEYEAKVAQEAVTA